MKRNSKFKIQNSKLNKGFTLFELLVVMIVVVTVGIIVSGILVSSLRGSNKTKALNNLENNGNYVIAQVSKITRFAKEFDGISVDGSAGSYTVNCSQVIPPSPTPSPTPVAYKYLKVTSYDGGQTVFSCEASTIASNSASMLDIASVTLTSCEFSCIQSSPSDFPIIGVKFRLTQYAPTGVVNFLPEQTASANFQTSVTPRNFSR